MNIHFCELNQDKVSEAWADPNLPAINSQGANTEFDIQDWLQISDQERMLAEIIKRDLEFINRASSASFTDSFNLQNEEILTWLFKAVLGVNIEDEDFFVGNAVTGIPLELWIDLFQKMLPQTMDTLKAKCKKTNYSFDDFRKYLLGIKNVVKYCLDNNSQMIAYYDGGNSGIMRDRAQKVYKRLTPGKETTV